MEHSQVALRGGTLVPPRIGERSMRQQIVLDEEEYTDGLSRIIQRDFFPQLPRLRAENAYLTALENGDEDAVRRTARALAREEERAGILEEREQRVRAGERLDPLPVNSPPPDTPSEATPVRTAPPTQAGGMTPRQPQTRDTGVRTDLSIDGYLARYTSEDNASFAQIQHVAAERRRRHHAWAYALEGPSDRAALPAPESGALVLRDGAQRPGWRFKTRNALMFAPDADVSTLTQRSSSRLGPSVPEDPPRVSHVNTRMVTRDSAVPAPDTPSSSVLDAAIAGERSDSPRVAGFGFVTPVGRDPYERRIQQLVDAPRGTGSETTEMDESGFKIPPAPRREMLAHRLASRSTPRTRRSSRAVELSPAARTLLERTHGTSSLYSRRSRGVTPRTNAVDNARRQRLAAQRWTPSPSPMRDK